MTLTMFFIRAQDKKNERLANIPAIDAATAYQFFKTEISPEAIVVEIRSLFQYEIEEKKLVTN